MVLCYVLFLGCIDYDVNNNFDGIICNVEVKCFVYIVFN